MTIEETSELLNTYQNSKDTLTKNVKPLTPLMVQSELEPMETKPFEGKVSQGREFTKETQRAKSEVYDDKSLKEMISVAQSHAGKVCGEKMFCASPYLKK